MNEQQLPIQEKRKRYAIKQSELASMRIYRSYEINKKLLLARGEILSEDDLERYHNEIKYRNYSKCILLMPLLVWYKSKNAYMRYLSIPVCIGMYYIMSDFISEYNKAKYSYSQARIAEMELFHNITKFN
jgi:hypothetical protein